MKSQVDLGKRRWGLDGASGGTHVSGVRRKRETSVIEAMVIATNESLCKNVCICLSIVVVPDAAFKSRFENEFAPQRFQNFYRSDLKFHVLVFQTTSIDNAKENLGEGTTRDVSGSLSAGEHVDGSRTARDGNHSVS